MVERSSGPTGSTSWVSVQAFGFCDFGSAIFEPYTRNPTCVPLGSAPATCFRAFFAAVNLVPPEAIRWFIEPDTSSTSSTLVDSSALARGAATQAPPTTSSRLSVENASLRPSAVIGAIVCPLSRCGFPGTT